MFCGWLYVFLSLIYISVTSTLDTTYDRLNHIVNSLQTLALAEIVHAAGHIVSGSWIGAFCLHFGRNLILMALLAPLPPLHTSYTVFALYLIFAIGEIIRYPYYLITTWDALLRMNNLFHTMLHTFFPPLRHMKKLIQLSTYARYTAPIILLPLGFITELMIIYNAYPLLEGMRLPMISYNANIIILIYAILAYSLGAPYLFMSMYRARHKKLGKPINVADKVD